MSKYLPDLITIFMPVAMIIFGHIMVMLTIWLKSKVKSEETKKFIDKLDDAVVDAVKSTAQLYVSKAKGSNSRLSDEAAKTAKEIAVTQVKNTLGDKALKSGTKLLNKDDEAMNQTISSKIEATVFDLKKGVVIALLAIFSLTSFTACNNSLHNYALGLSAQEKVVAVGDEAFSRLYSDLMKDCRVKGVKLRDQELKDGKPTAEARADGLIFYNDCSKKTDETATKIADSIDLIYSMDKDAAKLALAVAKKEESMQILVNHDYRVKLKVCELMRYLETVDLSPKIPGYGGC